MIENAEPYIVDYSDIRYFPNYIRNDFFNPKWVYIFNDSTQNGIEFVIRILKFPDQSVDTMTWQVKSYYTDGRYGTIANYYASFSVLKIWYNSEVRFDFKNHALNPDVFPDGRKKVYHDFQVIK